MQHLLDQIQSHIIHSLHSIGNPYIERMLFGLSSGKMLRSKLMLRIGMHPKIIPLCAIVEMIQSASLLHDDVIDDASMRRGRESVNVSFGSKNAILLGDVFYSQAFCELLDFDVCIAKSIARCVVSLASGEIEDVMLSENFHTDRQAYERMIFHKTASLIASSAQSVALLCGLRDDIYYEYGKNLGLAFQIIDDALDIFSHQNVMGKPTMKDFREKKVTLPYLVLHDCLCDSDRKKLRNLFAEKDCREGEAWILEKMRSNDVESLVRQQAVLYGQKALQAIESERNSGLVEIVEEMIFRKF